MKVCLADMTGNPEACLFEDGECVAHEPDSQHPAHLLEIAKASCWDNDPCCISAALERRMQS